MASPPSTRPAESEAADSAVSTPPSSPVVELIEQRIAAGSTPGNRSDGFKLALAIEGGGMRGVVSAGMVAALEQVGVLDAFDDIYGASAGSFNGAYLLSRRARLGTTIYYEDVNNNNFIDVRRALWPWAGPILCLDYMLNHVSEHVKPLDWTRIIESPIKLHPIAASLRHLRAVDLGDFSTKDELKLALKASATIPWIAGDPIRIGDDQFLDASVFESIPYHTAIADGATHILAFRTRPVGVLRGAPSPLERWIIARKLAKVEPRLVPLYLERAPQYALDVEELARASETRAEEPPHIYAAAVTAGPPVSQLEKDRDTLFAGAVAGFEAVYRLFDERKPSVAHELGGFFF